MKFTKMHGAGNDYVYVDCFHNPYPADPAALARLVSDRHFGIGGDGLILICPTEKADARMRMFNADGSESEMCGNGLRCVAKYVYDHAIATKSPLKIETGRGILSVEVEAVAGRVRKATIAMGQPILTASEIPTTLPGNPPIEADLVVDGVTYQVTCVSVGNPHCVIFVDRITDELVLGVGPKIENHPAFPKRVNVEFVKVNSRTDANMRVWERGSGETLACGTGACAVAVAGILTGRFDRTVTVHLLGGDLELHWDEVGGEVFLTGPTVEVFSGDWPETG